MRDPKWIRSSRCGPEYGNCVELNLRRTEVIIRDSKRGSAALLTFGYVPWTSFLERCIRR